MKKVTSELTTVTPAMALDLLENANDANRNVSEAWVGTLKQMILRGQWRITHQGIGIGDDGKLYDGQHRLWAIVRANQAVPMMVTRGLAEESRDAIDKGRKRTVADELGMFRGEKNTNSIVAFTTHCANLYSGKSGGGSKISIATVGMFDEWFPFFEGGIRWALEQFSTSTTLLRRTGVAGTLAYCHKLNPKAIEAFGVKVRDGIGLTKGEPAWIFRRAILEGQYAQRANYNTWEFTAKTARAAYAELNGERLNRLEGSAAPVKYFTKAYEDSRKLKQLAQPFRDVDQQVAPAASLNGAHAA